MKKKSEKETPRKRSTARNDDGGDSLWKAGVIFRTDAIRSPRRVRCIFSPRWVMILVP
jgi:hypothetical protein